MRIKKTATGRYSVSEASLNKSLSSLKGKEREMTLLRLEYMGLAQRMNNNIKKMDCHIIYPQSLPTQASGRWSVTRPALTNFDKECVNKECPVGEHEITNECWSIRDCIKPFPKEFWIKYDHNAIEARIYALILNWTERLKEFENDHDIHTPTCCDLFNLSYPFDKVNPHSSVEDEDWRKEVNWRGKDDGRRTIAKNFTFGSQYFYVQRLSKGRLNYNPAYVLTIPKIEQNASAVIGIKEETVVREWLVYMVDKYVQSTKEIQLRKADFQEKIRKDKKARTLYGMRRVFFTMDKNTAKEGFNHVIQGTVAEYMNESFGLLKKEWPDCRIVHNEHDGAKIAFPYSHDKEEVIGRFKEIVERNMEYEGRSVKLTIGSKIYG